jgi:RimJ/RimL family protein N-acetyltransferase
MRVPATRAWCSESLQLFLLEESDVTERYVGWLNDPEVNRYLESRFERQTLESTRAFVNGCINNDKALLLGIRCRWLEDQHVGNIKVEINRPHGLGEVGILIGEAAVHGKGIATQAIRMMVTIAREQLGLRKLTAGCYASNVGSERAFAKAGFTVEGHRPNHFLVDGRTETLTLMGMIL